MKELPKPEMNPLYVPWTGLLLKYGKKNTDLISVSKIFINNVTWIFLLSLDV